MHCVLASKWKSFLNKACECIWTGLFSVIMRDLANLTSDGPKWIVLDGDIDPMWIESLNTVMDDNKVLTLASNERIPLTPMMRLLFEISHLKTATPATVSRAGILYINPADLGWNPLVVILENKYLYEPCTAVARSRCPTSVRGTATQTWSRRPAQT